MKTSEKAKAAGFKNLAELSDLIDTSRQTLNNWQEHKPKLFKAVLLGAPLMRDNDERWSHTEK